MILCTSSSQISFVQRILVFLAGGLILVTWPATAADLKAGVSGSQPNILFIYLDDFGWRDATYMGSDFYKTPHIDDLAAAGMVFTDAYAAAANCAPSRACLLSGQYSPRHQIFNVGTRPRGKSAYRRLEHIPGVDTLDPHIRTWAHQIRTAGYATATIGKWHLSQNPRPYGFDVNIGGDARGSPPGGYFAPFSHAPGLEEVPEGEYLTDRLTNEAIKFIRANRDRPWLVYLTHFAVHTPLEGKPDLVEEYRAKPPGKLHRHPVMAAMIEAVDEGIGRIQSALEEWGLTDRTIIIFYSDNGGYGPATDMDPLKGYKGTYYEGGIRVPFFVKWPGMVAPGAQCAEPITGVDLYPTLCEMAGAALPADQPLDGTSLVALLKGEVESLGNRALFWHFPAYLESYSVVDEQRDVLFRTRPCSIIRVGQWKLHQYFEDNGLELYNLRNDIGESTNLATQFPGKTTSLLHRLESWRQRLNAPVPTALNPDFDAREEAAARKRRLDRSRARD